MNVAEELREHAKRVEKGWRRGTPLAGEACVSYWNNGGALCYLTDTSIDAVDAFVHARFGDPFETGVCWNDSLPSEGGPVNRRQVAAVLRRAADAWERENIDS